MGSRFGKYPPGYKPPETAHERSAANNTERRKIKLLDSQRQLLVSQMYLSGCMTMEMIAQRLNAMGYTGIKKQDISRDINFLEEKWRKESVENIAETVRKELAKLDALEHEAFECLRGNPLLGDKIPNVDREKYVDQILRIQDRRVKLLGLDKKKVEVSGPGGGPLKARLADMTDEDLVKIIDGQTGVVTYLPEARIGTAIARLTAGAAVAAALGDEIGEQREAEVSRLPEEGREERNDAINAN